MDLQNGNITVGQLLKEPGARKILMTELPELANSPLLRFAGGMSLNRVLTFAKGNVTDEKVKRILSQLKAL